MRLNLTRHADHALRAMAWLAGQPRGARRKAAEIASAAGIPGPFAARVLAGLHREGLLHARAGHDGGYALVRRPADVTLLEVIEAVEGPLCATDCLLRDGRCGSGGGYCELHQAWSTAQSAFRQVLADTSLADSLAHGRAPARASA